jgi:hypothetical protein
MDNKKRMYLKRNATFEPLVVCGYAWSHLKLPGERDGSGILAGSDYGKRMWLPDVFIPKKIYVSAMGQEPWVEFISSIKHSRKRALIAESLYEEKELLYEDRFS